MSDNYQYKREINTILNVRDEKIWKIGDPQNEKDIWKALVVECISLYQCAEVHCSITFRIRKDLEAKTKINLARAEDMVDKMLRDFFEIAWGGNNRQKDFKTFKHFWNLKHKMVKKAIRHFENVAFEIGEDQCNKNDKPVTPYFHLSQEMLTYNFLSKNNDLSYYEKAELLKKKWNQVQYKGRI